jgi:hypothetical protein
MRYLDAILIFALACLALWADRAVWAQPKRRSMARRKRY